MTKREKKRKRLKAERKKRARERKSRLPPVERDYYQTVDGNFTRRPAAYCEHYRAWLTVGQMEVHRCEKRHCRRLHDDRRDARA